MSFSLNLGPLAIIAIAMSIVLIISCNVISKKPLPSWEIEKRKSIIAMLVLFVLLVCLTLTFVLTYNYHKLISINNETQKEYIQILPNEHVTTGQYTFCVNGKLQKTEITDSTRYIQDSKDKPYIIVDKVTYNAPYVWYVDQDEIQKVNKEVDYKLKEVHY